MIWVIDVVAECRDTQDNKFLELALSGKGSLIITGDSDLLVLHPFRGIAIVGPQSFVVLPVITDLTTEPSNNPDRHVPGEMA